MLLPASQPATTTPRSKRATVVFIAILAGLVVIGVVAAASGGGGGGGGESIAQKNARELKELAARAEGGDVAAMTKLAAAYRSGIRGADEDPQLAMKYTRQAAAKGDADSIDLVGVEVATTFGDEAARLCGSAFADPRQSDDTTPEGTVIVFEAIDRSDVDSDAPIKFTPATSAPVPPARRALDRNEVKTLVCQLSRLVRIGAYEKASGSRLGDVRIGARVDDVLLVLDWPGGAIQAWKVFEGGAPPDEIPGGSTSEVVTGSSPSKVVESEWLEGLFTP